MEDHRSFISEFPYLSLLISKDPFFTLTHHCQLSQMVVSRAFYSKCIGRVHTSRLVAQGGEGREEVTFGAWHTFQHHSLSLSGHDLSPRYLWWFSRPNGTVRESTTRERKLTDIPAPRKILAAHTIHLPMPPRLSPYLPPILEFLYIYGACGIWKTTGEATRWHIEQ